MVLDIVKTDALNLRDSFSDDRRTEISDVAGEVDIEDLIPEEECVFTMTRMGYIKRMSADEYRIQKKGGRGKIGITRREEDEVDTMFTCSTHDNLMFLSSKGRAYKLKGYEIPEGSRTSKGLNVVNILPLEPEEKISAMLDVPDDRDDKFVCMITRNGVIKRTELTNFRNIRRSGIIAINLDEGDELIDVRITEGNDDLYVATKKGMGIRFNEQDARAIGRAARGVKAISFKYPDDEVVAMEILKEGDGGKLLTVSSQGIGRKSDYADYRIQGRGGYGTINYRTERFGDVAAVRVVYDDDDAILITESGVMIRLSCDEIRECARPSKGVILMKLGEGDRVITMTTAKKSEEEPADALPEDHGADAETEEDPETATDAAKATETEDAE